MRILNSKWIKSICVVMGIAILASLISWFGPLYPLSTVIIILVTCIVIIKTTL
jgi:hypothetical protein